MRRVAAALVAGALVVAGVLGTASAAQAHNYLVASTPTAGEKLTALPDAFVITTNEPLLTVGGSTGGFALQVLDAKGLHYETGCVTVEGSSMTMADPRLGAAGAYVVEWQVVSEDGHPVSDSIPFTWAPPADAEPSIGTASAPACGDALPTAEPTDAPSAPPTAPSAPDRSADIPVADVLWIGGALVAVGAAVGIAILVLGRRTRT